MFTGIVSDLGEVLEISGKGDVLFKIRTAFDVKQVPIGASIANNGVCLTVIDRGSDWFAVQASAETLDKTTLGRWAPGSRVNLERAMRIGDELGGHIVSGHVDGVATVVGIRPENDSLRFTFEAPDHLKRFVAPKGSVAIDGVSLTVNEVEGARFGINIIPHTKSVTTFGGYAVGSKVNMEIDMLARYVARLLEKD
ncbi:riboflavin synthase [Telmatospirillum siberiense]|uniref:Riboflavin synthase n=1 Tax=Telmatospirillum siberiense TaxID=382514 RepID=A0A2N3PYU2_9PROT|nr:riboflavin synthase [Telmatospirillum siberiense]PKU25555.1 riboflavin synthase [Telmatospirillum siberiense]